MPHFTYDIRAAIKDDQKDTANAAALDAAGDVNITSYLGAIRLVVPKGQSKIIDLSTLGSASFVMLKQTGSKPFRLRLKKAQTENTDLLVGRFFAAQIHDMDVLHVYAPADVDLDLKVQLAG